MKFGEQLKSRMNQEWRFYYIDYDGLKKLLKERTSAGTFFAEGDEASFVQALEKEVEKVFDFRDVKGGELTRHVQHCETQVRSKMDNAVELAQMEEEVGRITNELTELANFTRMNYTGFLKILKKHDKYTAFMLKPMFMVRLNSKPLYMENLDNLIIRLSKLYDVIRTGGQRPDSNQSGDKGAQTFVRRTTKYWVHPDNVTDLKCFILKHLPVLVFDKKSGEVDPAISSVYFDNDQMELYTGRLEKSEGAIALRFRWYGKMEPSEVFVERKTHREDWTGETSVKSRFSIKEKHVNDFIAGKYSVTKAADKMRQRGEKGEAELSEMVQLADEIQQVIKLKKLRPTVRTFYNRTAFQLPGDARVRISLDTELTMIREDDPRNQGNWRRPDVLVQYPFGELPSGDVCRFPYAVLEVKLQTQQGQEPPKWAQELVQSHLVEEVPKFSKFIHGCSTLLESKVNLFPFWLPQMDVDIRKQLPVDEVAEALNDLKRSDDVIIQMGEEEADDDDDDLSKAPTDSEEKQPLLKKHKPFKAVIPPKKIAVPVRVEPKVFFANERTFLSWIQFSVFLGSMSSVFIALDNPSARVSGMVFMVVSVLFALYALFLYQWRAYKIRRRDPGPYDDRVGPVVLVVVFLCAICFNFIFHYIESGKL